MTGTYKNKNQLPKDTYDVTSLGGGVSLSRQQQVKFTPELAEQFILGFEEFQQDRALRQNHVDYLVNCVIRGTFRWENVILAVAYCRENKKSYRINGQHTSWMRTALGNSIQSPIVLKRMYQCETFDDVRHLYASFDRNASRTPSNVGHVWLLNSPEFPDASKRELSLLVAGLKRWQWPLISDKKWHDADEVAYLLRTEFCLDAQRVLTLLRIDKGAKHVLRGPVIAAMLGTCHKHPTIASEFWQRVILGTDITKSNAPERKLRDFLLSSNIGRNRGRTIGDGDMQVACLLAWNAHKEGRTLNSLRLAAVKGLPTIK